MLLPAAALAELERRWQRRRGEWLLGKGSWPEPIALNEPSQALVESEDGFRTFGHWLKAWRPFEAVTIRNVNWSRLGPQALPTHWCLGDATIVAAALGQTVRWERALAALQRFKLAWPDADVLHARLANAHFDALADAADGELERVINVLRWLQTNPTSGLYPRQIPVSGIDSKWLTGRARILGDALAALQPDAVGSRFVDRAGLRELPDRVRMRVPDPALAAHLGGFDDVAVPIEQLARLDIPVRRVLIVENLQTGLACDGLPGTLVLMARGYAVQYASSVPWLARVPVFYWGDIDTHGLAILDRLRAHLPHVVSVLMDEQALRSCPLDRAGVEDVVHQAHTLPRLTAEEQAFYGRLRSGGYGASIRLEQERIDWSYAISRLRIVLAD
jgi:hypothetical protein